ncbi:4a-hydroxytetrahydrobiopterin dehydratase [Nocardioides sp. GXZ039]|uniref:4a-hydroxytetrahydrobiopterin dehydratase n=1 Tax=Nocardioides sp. GXZ039 TaxID=3136018 RepID=UPI0030F470BB
MSDADARLSTSEVAEAGLADWRQIMGSLKARFAVGDFATGLRLVEAIGAFAERAGHHPALQVTSTEVIVTLMSHDVGGITAHDLGLAESISNAAAALGLRAEPDGLTQLDLGLDTSHRTELAPFYAALLGSTLHDGEPVDSTGQVPTVWWQEPGDDAEWALPAQEFDQRWHFDVWVAHDEAERRLQAVLDAGGRLVSDRGAPSFWVIEDADGNRSCICTPAGR